MEFKRVAKGIEGCAENVAQGIGNKLMIATDSLNITRPIKHGHAAQDPSKQEEKMEEELEEKMEEEQEEKMEEGKLPQVSDLIDIEAKDYFTEESENEAILLTVSLGVLPIQLTFGAG
jgi:hypothetical protein